MSQRLSTALLILVLLGHLFLLASHERARGNRLEAWLLASLGPVGHGVVAVAAALRDAAGSLRLAGSLRRENAELRHEVDALRREVARLQGVEETLERLSRDTGYVRPETGGVIVADVVWVDQGSGLRSLVLYTGTAEPRRNQPVLTDQGLVGRIVVPAGRYAKVVLLTDPSMAASAMIERTRQRGLVRGGGDGPLALEHIPLRADVELGDVVVTAGIDGVFPRGLRLGRVGEIADGPGLFRQISLTPAVDFAALDQVYVLTREAVPAAIRDATVRDGVEGIPPPADPAGASDAGR